MVTKGSLAPLFWAYFLKLALCMRQCFCLSRGTQPFSFSYRSCKSARVFVNERLPACPLCARIASPSLLCRRYPPRRAPFFPSAACANERHCWTCVYIYINIYRYMKYIGVYLNAGRCVSPLAQTSECFTRFWANAWLSRDRHHEDFSFPARHPLPPSPFFSKFWWLLFMAPVQMWGNAVVFLFDSLIFFIPIAFRKALYII